MTSLPSLPIILEMQGIAVLFGFGRKAAAKDYLQIRATARDRGGSFMSQQARRRAMGLRVRFDDPGQFGFLRCGKLRSGPPYQASVRLSGRNALKRRTRSLSVW